MKKQTLIIILLAMFVASCLALTACHEHELGEWTVVSSATCTDAGLKERTCECGVKETEVIPATGHTAGDWVTDVDSSCTQTGVKHQVCSKCEAILDIDSISSTGHTFGAWTVAAQPTCTQQGQEQRTCDCGEVETRLLDLAEHTYSSVVTEPTCTTQGYTTHTCACGNSYVDTPVDELGHTAGSWTTDIAPSCTHAGSKHQVCSVCDEIIAIETIEATGHTFGNWATLSMATCTQKGQEQRTCACGEVETKDVNATGHTEGEWIVDIAPSCTHAGSKHQICATCNEIIAIESIQATGHSYTSTTIAPTCTDKGYTTHTCSTCGDSYVDSYVDATGHTFGNWTLVEESTCTQKGLEQRVCACGETETRDVALAKHTFGNWTVAQPATCTEQGLELRFCQCGASQSQAIDALGHDESTHNAQDATCTSIGWSEYVSCSRCDYSTYQEIPATAHTFGNWTVVNAATCTQNGLELRFCSCGATQTRAIPAPGHTDGEWITDLEPTCTAQGSKHQVCAVCDETLKTESIDATGHTYDETVVDATCTSQGYTLHTCHCGDNYKDNYVEANGEHNFQESETCAYCEQNIADVAVETYNMSATADDNVKGYVVARADGNYDAYINGIGAMKDYDDSPFSVDGYTLINAYIENGVTSIGRCAFHHCYSLTNITIPSSVTNIGDMAFSFCRNIISVIIPNGVTRIGINSFTGCDNLTNVTIPCSVEVIDQCAFTSCTKLEDITIEGSPQINGYAWSKICAFNATAYYNDANNWENKVLYIGSCLIEAKTTIESCVIKEGTTSIAGGAFEDCTSLTNITIPSSVVVIAPCAFLECNSLTDVYITDIAAWCNINFVISDSHPSAKNLYLNNQLVTELVLPEEVTSIGQYAFYRFQSLTSIIVPDSVTSIGDYAFYDCNSLQSLVIGDSITSIGYYAFGYCTSLTSVVIPNSVTNIGKMVFAGCSNLTSVTIGEALTSIDYYAFAWCNKISTVYYAGTMQQWQQISIDNTGSANKYLKYANIIYNHPDHNYVPVVTSPTCTEQGYTTYTCHCGDTYIDDYVDALSHSYNAVVTLPTCTTQGYTTYTCYCGYSYVDTYVDIDPLAHNYVDGICSYCSHRVSVGLEYTLSEDGNSYIVTRIGTCTDTDVVIPSTYQGKPVTSIGVWAFSCCSLTSITIPNSITSIGEYAFESCESLTSITIPSSVTSIGNWVFDYCYSLASINVSENNTSYQSIDGNVYSKDGKTLVIYAPGKTDTSSIIPEGVTSIGNYAFYHCKGLTSVTISEGVTSIGESAFELCRGLTSITIPSSVTSIGDRAFLYCESLTSITIPSSLTSIGYGVFAYCKGLTSITIPNSVTSIGDYAFYYCTGLTSITIPSSVTSIGNWAFDYCSSLASITIPEGVTSIGDYSFRGCTSLASINVGENNTAYQSIDGNLYSKDGKTLIIYAPGKTDTSFIIPEGVTSIGNSAFYNCKGLTSITIPSSVTSISNYSFNGCSSLTSITIPEGVTSIGNYSFNGCTSLTSITIPSNVTSIGEHAFYNCKGLTSITIPSSVTSIGNSVFRGCSSLTSITIPKGVTSIGNYSFNGCTSLTSITIPSSVTSIGEHAFYNCSSLTSITIPEGVTSIDNYSFNGCTKLTSITIPSSVTSIGSYAFSGCRSLTTVCYTGTQEQWNNISIGSSNSALTNANIVFNHPDHDYVPVVTDPTCTTQGYTTYTCYCGDSYVDTYVDATGHTEGHWIVDSEPTCTQNGSKHQVCATCGETLKTGIIPATSDEHSYVNDYICAICGAINPNADTTSKTYNLSTSSIPENWNVLTSQTNDANLVLDYTQDTLYAFDYNEDKTAYKVVPSMAASYPVDVSAQYAERFGYDASLVGKAYRIELKDNLRYDNGDPITAHSFVESVKRLLDPQAANSRADSLYSGNMVIHNAEVYVKQGSLANEGAYKFFEDWKTASTNNASELIFSIENSYIGNLFASYYSAEVIANNGGFNGVYSILYGAGFGALTALTGKTWAEISANADLKAAWDAVLPTWNPAPNEELHFFVKEVIYPEISWDDVGFFAEDDHNLVIVLIDPMPNDFWLKLELCTNFGLVHTPTYDACASVVDGKYTNNYGTSVDTYVGYGPYKLVSYDADSALQFVKNRYWYDFSNTEIYQATGVVIKQVDAEEQLQMFLKGELDHYDLREQDMAQYGASPYTYYVESEDTWFVAMNPDEYNLAQKAQAATPVTAGNTVIKQPLAIKEFRQALSYSLDRTAFCLAVSVLGIPAKGTLSSAIVLDPEAGLSYRSTDEAKDAILAFWGLSDKWGPGKQYATRDEAIASITGYDLDGAKQLFTQAYNIAVQNGWIPSGNNWELQLMIGASNWGSTFYSNGYDFLSSNWVEAVKGTPWEGHFVCVKSDSLGNGWGNALRSGEIDMLFGVGWGASTFDPYSMLNRFVRDDLTYDTFTNKNEIMLDIEIDGQTLRASLAEWLGECIMGYTIDAKVVGVNGELTGATVSVNAGLSAPSSLRLKILAACEVACLDICNTIPLMTSATAHVKSHRIVYETEQYIYGLGFGGLKYLDFTMTDAEWAAYIIRQGGVLDYTGSNQGDSEDGGEVVPPAEEHTCESICETCAGCIDESCTEDVCATKCECNQGGTTPPKQDVTITFENSTGSRTLNSTGEVYFTASRAVDNWEADRGLQFEKQKGTVTLTSTTTANNVATIVLDVSANKTTDVTITVKVGNTVFTCNGQSSATFQNIKHNVLTFTSATAASGTIEITAVPAKTNESGLGSVYFKSITISATGTGGSVTPPSGSNNVMPEQSYNKNNHEDYDDILSDAIKANDEKEGYLESTALPSQGEYNVLVIPVEFSNDKFTAQELSDLNDAFNNKNKTGWESVSSYYNTSSYGKLNLTFDIADKVTLGSTYGSFDGGNDYGADILKLAMDALEARGFDFTKYDHDNNGVIDGVYIIYSSPIDYDGDYYWAYVAATGDETEYDGLYVYTYLFASVDFMYEDIETSGSDYAIDGLQLNAVTYIHETGHMLGLDDYYDYNPGQGSDQGLGNADMMDYTVGDHNAYSKLLLGWVKPTVVTSTQTVTISAFESSGQFVMVLLDYDGTYFSEYLIIDLYSATGLNALHAGVEDSLLYEGAEFGARIYHVDATIANPYSDDYFSFTDNNNSVSRDPLIKLVEADGDKNFESDQYQGYSYASEDDLWQTGDVLIEIHANYTRNDGKVVNFDISFDSVAANSMTITITFNTAT